MLQAPCHRVGFIFLFGKFRNSDRSAHVQWAGVYHCLGGAHTATLPAGGKGKSLLGAIRLRQLRQDVFNSSSMQPDDSPASEVSVDPGLKAFYDACIVEALELDYSVEHANRTSLRMAPVTALEIIYGAPQAGRRPVSCHYLRTMSRDSSFSHVVHIYGFRSCCQRTRRSTGSRETDRLQTCRWHCRFDNACRVRFNGTF